MTRGEVLWTPPDDAWDATALGRFATAAGLRRLRRADPLVDRRPRRLLAGGDRVHRRALGDAAGSDPRRRHDARRALVPRRHAQLRRAGPGSRATPIPTTSPSSPSARPATAIELTWDELTARRAALRRGAAPARRRRRATASSPTPRTSPRRSSPSSPRRRSGRSGRAARPSSACARSSTASPRSSRSCSSPSTATATAPRTSTAPSTSPRSSPPCRRCATSSTSPTSTPTGRPPASGDVEYHVWDELLVGAAAEPLTFTPVPADHPLYVLFSSGHDRAAQGDRPRPRRHRRRAPQGARPSTRTSRPADRFFWFTTTGWMMWNYLVSGLLTGSTIVLFDGDPASPDLSTLWKLAADTGHDRVRRRRRRS